MTKTGHVLSGVGAGILAFALADLTGATDLALVAVVLAFFGATAPDWLEVPWRFSETRLSLIPHRRITHWVLGWLVLLGTGIALAPELLGVACLGFAVGGLTHLLMDIPNPMGVPLIHPWRRTSLKLWTSGKRELLLIACWTLLTGTLFWLVYLRGH